MKEKEIKYYEEEKVNRLYEEEKVNRLNCPLWP